MLNTIGQQLKFLKIDINFVNPLSQPSTSGEFNLNNHEINALGGFGAGTPRSSALQTSACSQYPGSGGMSVDPSAPAIVLT
jgi:hypothetical protein